MHSKYGFGITKEGFPIIGEIEGIYPDGTFKLKPGFEIIPDVIASNFSTQYISHTFNKTEKKVLEVADNGKPILRLINLR